MSNKHFLRGMATVNFFADDMIAALDAPTALALGTIEPRKNLARLVEAWRLLHGEVGLVLAGAIGRFPTAAGLAGDLDALHHPQGRRERPAERRVVINHQHPHLVFSLAEMDLQGRPEVSVGRILPETPDGNNAPNG